MNYRSLFFLLLLPTTTAHPMEKILRTTQRIALERVTIYNIAPRLDRDDRTALKLTNNFFCNIIIPQHILNEQYQLACATKNIEQSNELRRKGALMLEEEVYKLFLSHKKNLVIHIIPRRGKSNIMRTIFFYGIQQNNLSFIQWLLDTEKPHYESLLIDKYFKYANSCNHTEIAQLFKNYRHDGTRKYWDEMMKNAEPIPEPLVIMNNILGTENLDKSCIIS
jgi:hypothetical protein